MRPGVALLSHREHRITIRPASRRYRDFAQSRPQVQAHCTINVTVVECTAVPEVAVTTIEYVPAGVPFGLLSTVREAQPARYPAIATSRTNAAVGTKRRSGDRSYPARPIPARNSAIAESANHVGNDVGTLGSCGPSGRAGVAETVVRDVVVTVIVVLVPGVTELGLNVASAPVGKPDAVKVTWLDNVPATGAVVITNIADPPAATVCGPVGLDML